MFDTFTYVVTDEAGGQAIATATVPVGGVNDLPIPVIDRNEIDEDSLQSIAGNLVENDVDVDQRILVTPANVALIASSEAFPIGRLIDSSGINIFENSTNIFSFFPDAVASDQNAWMTQSSGSDYFESGVAPVLEFDLGGTSELQGIVFLSFFLDANQPSR
ncbi:MAG: hypothetical protein R3C05_12320 [Pirellulaceae bacterium]